MARRIGKRQRAVLERVQAAGLLALGDMDRRDRSAVDRLVDLGLVTVAHEHVAPVIDPCSVPEESQALLRGKTGKRAPVPKIMIRLAGEDKDRLLAVRPEGVRELLGLAVEVGLDAAVDRLAGTLAGRGEAEPGGKGGPAVYGCKVEASWEPALKGGDRSRQTRRLLLLALAVGWEDAVTVVADLRAPGEGES